MSQVLRLTDRNFDQEVTSSDVPILVEFWASWCLPCKVAEPMLARLASEYDGRAMIAKLNVDQNPRSGGKYQIMGLPTFILFNSGHECERRVGAQTKGQLTQMIDASVKSQEL